MFHSALMQCGLLAWRGQRVLVSRVITFLIRQLASLRGSISKLASHLEMRLLGRGGHVIRCASWHAAAEDASKFWGEDVITHREFRG